MTNEEQRNRVRNILQDFYRRDEYELEQATDDVMRLIPSLPPAEGAEEILHKYVHTINSDGTSLVTFMGALKAMREFAAQQQPTAEGAEEILDKHSRYHPVTNLVYREDVLSAMNEFAALHAQRLAEKMVEEKLKEELIAYDKWVGEKYIDNYRHETAPAIVDEYLKSRER